MWVPEWKICMHNITYERYPPGINHTNMGAFQNDSVSYIFSMLEFLPYSDVARIYLRAKVTILLIRCLFCSTPRYFMQDLSGKMFYQTEVQC